MKAETKREINVSKIICKRDRQLTESGFLRFYDPSANITVSEIIW